MKCASTKQIARANGASSRNFKSGYSSTSLKAKARIVEHNGSVLKGSCEIVDDVGRTVVTFTSVFKLAKNAVIENITFDRS